MYLVVDERGRNDLIVDMDATTGEPLNDIQGFLTAQFRFACYNRCGYIVNMVVELRLRKVGNSVGLVLPKEALARMRAEEGDALYLTESVDGGFRLTANNPGFAEKLKAAERLSRRYRHALKELAK